MLCSLVHALTQQGRDKRLVKRFNTISKMLKLEMKHAPNIVQPLNIVQRGMSNGPVLLGSTVLDAIK